MVKRFSAFHDCSVETSQEEAGEGEVNDGGAWLLPEAHGSLSKVSPTLCFLAPALPIPISTFSPAPEKAGLCPVCSQKLTRRVCCNSAALKGSPHPWTRSVPELGPKCLLCSLTSVTVRPGTAGQGFQLRKEPGEDKSHGCWEPDVEILLSANCGRKVRNERQCSHWQKYLHKAVLFPLNFYLLI